MYLFMEFFIYLVDIFENLGESRFSKDSYIIKESTKNFFWTKIDIESIHIKVISITFKNNDILKS